MTDVQPFTFDDLKKRIAEDVQSKFGSMIPPEVFEDMIEQSVRKFFESTTETFRVTRVNYASSEVETSLSPFQIIVWSKLRDIVRPALDKWFGEKQEEITKMMEEALQTNTNYGATLNSAVGPMVTGMAQVQALAAMRQATYPYQLQVAQTLSHAGIMVPWPIAPNNDPKEILKGLIDEKKY